MLWNSHDSLMVLKQPPSSYESPHHCLYLTAAESERSVADAAKVFLQKLWIDQKRVGGSNIDF